MTINNITRRGRKKLDRKRLDLRKLGGKKLDMKKLEGRKLDWRRVEGKLNHRFLAWSIVFLLLLLLVPQVMAIGIRPAKTTIESETVKDTTGTFWVVNNDQLSFSASVYLEGELASSVTLLTKELVFREDVDALPVQFEVHLPSQIPPGTSTANIVVEQNFESSAEGVSSRLVLKHKILALGPYPDKYATVKVNFHESGDRIEFVSEVENIGKLDIGNVKTQFYVNDRKQEQQTLETEGTALKTKENKLLKATLPKSSFDNGEYEVSSVTTYDDQQVEVIKNLVIGAPDVEVAYFDKYFMAHKINQYTLDLLNKWNKDLKNVFVDVEVKKDGMKVDEFRTKSIDLPATLTQKIQDYYDARERNPGAYTFNLVVNFWNLVRMDQKEFVVQAELLDEKTPIPTGQAANQGGQGSSSSSSSSSSSLTAFFVLAGLLVAGAGGYVGWRYVHREEYEED